MSDTVRDLPRTGVGSTRNNMNPEGVAVLRGNVANYFGFKNR